MFQNTSFKLYAQLQEKKMPITYANVENISRPHFSWTYRLRINSKVWRSLFLFKTDKMRLEYSLTWAPKIPSSGRRFFQTWKAYIEGWDRTLPHDSSAETNKRLQGGCHSSADPSVPTILRPWVWLPTTTTLFSIYIWISMIKGRKYRAGALVQWLWEETHGPKVMGSNPSSIHWMDIYLLLKL